MKHIEEGDCVIGKRLSFECRKITLQKVYRKSESHRGQRGNIYDGECWIETSISLPEKKKK